MKLCPVCNTRTQVFTTAGSQDVRDPDLRQDAKDAIDGWTVEWTARQRSCPGCGRIFDTIELAMEDLEWILAATRKEGADEAAGAQSGSVQDSDLRNEMAASRAYPAHH